MEITGTFSHQILAMDINRHFRAWEKGIGYGDQLNWNYESLLFDLQIMDTFMVANNYDPHTLSGIYTYDTQNQPLVVFEQSA